MNSKDENIFANEIDSLKTMFGDQVSVPVIIAVLESCDGDVNLAADGIMNLITEGPASPDEEENATGGSYQPELHIPTNIPKPPDASKIAKIPKFEMCPQNVRPERTRNDNLYSNFPLPSQDVRVRPPPTSYATVSRNTGAIPKLRGNVNSNSSSNQDNPTTNKHNITRDIHNITQNMSKMVHVTGNSWNQQFKNILSHHNKGSRLMIIMRGVPGSGKSWLARHIIEVTVGGSYENFSKHIFSSDDFFSLRGKYVYDRNNLQAAHETNQRKVIYATTRGVSPVIVDNTHVHIWEMYPYVKAAVKNGYYIEIVEPNTPWAKSVHQLAKRNIHNVPKDKIKKMLDNYEEDITVDKVFTNFKLFYAGDKQPPVLRKSPPPPEQIPYVDFIESPPNPPNSPKPPSTPGQNNQSATQETSAVIHTSATQSSNDSTSNNKQPANSDEADTGNVPNDDIHLIHTDTQEGSSKDLLNCLNVEESKRLDKILEAQKKQEEIVTIEMEWENGESWDTVSKNTTSNKPLPPRSLRKESGDNKLIESSDICEDWTQISMFLPRWQENTNPISDNTRNAIKTTASGTSIEIGDVGNSIGLYKILECNPRDINNLISFEDKIERIPLQRMLDKSTSTHEHSLAETQRCKNEEKHFVAFRKMFKTVSRPVLRDIFDKCLGDVNWAVNIVLDSFGDSEIGTRNSDELSDTEENNEDTCECLAAYNIIPASSSPQLLPVSTEINQQDPDNATPNSQRKPKKERKVPENEKNLELKRQIESHVVISDNHYSQHFLSLKRGRQDNIVPDMFKPSTSNINYDETIPKSSTLDDSYNNNVIESDLTTIPVVNNDDTATNCLSEQQQPSNLDWYSNASATPSNFSDTLSLDDDHNSVYENITVPIGIDLVNKLDEVFGRQGIIYPENIKPVVSIPMRVLKELNALWAESIAFQMDNATNQTKEMINEDEEFARQLVLKEKEKTQEGMEGDVPNFKELMDMDLALSIYEKDVAEWRNSEPQDMAARMTRDKLYKLFPNIKEETLSELLMAHENNFHSTVESLLVSTGQSHILESKNGINKFIMKMELDKKEKILDEGRKALSETEWPLLPQPGYVVTMDTVNYYRDEAQRFLQARQENFRKAQYYSSRNQLSVASFYSDIASYNTRRLEQANSLAAFSLIQYHAANTNSDIFDLHYLRVAEAKESLDMFIDMNIRKLREGLVRPRHNGNWFIYAITGRGVHSPGLPRVKPAVIKRLHERRLEWFESNPGLLGIILTEHKKLTHEFVRD